MPTFRAAMPQLAAHVQARGITHLTDTRMIDFLHARNLRLHAHSAYPRLRLLGVTSRNVDTRDPIVQECDGAVVDMDLSWVYLTSLPSVHSHAVSWYMPDTFPIVTESFVERHGLTVTDEREPFMLDTAWHGTRVRCFRYGRRVCFATRRRFGVERTHYGKMLQKAAAQQQIDLRSGYTYLLDGDNIVQVNYGIPLKQARPRGMLLRFADTTVFMESWDSAAEELIGRSNKI